MRTPSGTPVACGTAGDAQEAAHCLSGPAALRRPWDGGGAAAVYTREVYMCTVAVTQRYSDEASLEASLSGGRTC